MRVNLQPDRLLAEGNVVGDSPQFSTKSRSDWNPGSPLRRLSRPSCMGPMGPMGR